MPKKTPRISFPDAVRSYVFARDQYRCQMCGATENLTIDHIIPLSQGGTNDLSNLRTLCHCCNSRKGDRPDPNVRRYFS